MAPEATVYVIDDDPGVVDSLRLLISSVDLTVETHASPGDFLERFDAATAGCVVLDIRMPGMSGLEVLARLRERAATHPVIVITGHGDVTVAVRAMKLGAAEFFEKPVNDEFLLECIQHWTAVAKAALAEEAQCAEVRDRLAKLSRREREVLDCVLDGLSNKEAARRLGVSPRAIEIYRSKLMQKMKAESVAELVREVLGCPRFKGHSTDRPPCLYSGSNPASTIRLSRAGSGPES